MRIQATNVFRRNFKSDKRIVINRGGTRSSKTFSIMQQYWNWLLTGQFRENIYRPEGIASIVRKTLPALKKTAYRDFTNFLHKTDTYKLVEHSKTDNTFVYDGRMIEFFAVDDEQKARGSGRNFLWCVEGNELQYDEEFFQLFIRTEDVAVIDFNPDDEYIWINTELEQKRALDRGDVDIIVSTHRDNPFLPEIMHEEIEYLINTNPAYYEIYGLGNYGKLEGLVHQFEVCSYSDLSDIPVYSYGLDFGFSNHPTALIEIYKKDNKVYGHEIIYETGLTNDDIADMLDTLQISKNIPIIADSAEPKSIEELNRRGYTNVVPCTKGKDSIKFGIDKLNQFKLYLTSSSPNAIKECRKYVWLKDKTGRPMNKPIDKDDHLMNAWRYGMDFTPYAPLITF